MTPRERYHERFAAICRLHGTNLEELLSPCRAKNVVRARTEAAEYLVNVEKLSQSQAGRILGRVPASMNYLLSPPERRHLWYRRRKAALGSGAPA